MKTTLLGLAIASLCYSLVNAYTVPSRKGLEVRVCQDRDCLTDGGKETLELLQDLSKGTNAKVVTCGCIGPCGGGPNVDVRQDNIRIKDSRPGQSNYYIWRQINSAEAGAKLLETAGVSVSDSKVASLSNKVGEIKSTRKWSDPDRTTRIALQRLLYVVTLLPLADADQKGTWDIINGQVYENSYYAIAAAVFIGSQFMGTDSKANAAERQE